jgi:hypothetical protein
MRSPVSNAPAVQRDEKIQLIKWIIAGQGFQIAPSIVSKLNIYYHQQACQLVIDKKCPSDNICKEVLMVWVEFDRIFSVAKAHNVKKNKVVFDPSS